MLVLTRKADEAVVIAGTITIRVLGVQGGRVRLGVEAPDDLLVMREEVASRLGLHDAAPQNRAPLTATE